MSVTSIQGVENKYSLAVSFAFDLFCYIPSCLLWGLGIDLFEWFPHISFTLLGLRLCCPVWIHTNEKNVRVLQKTQQKSHRIQSPGEIPLVVLCFTCLDHATALYLCSLSQTEGFLIMSLYKLYMYIGVTSTTSEIQPPWSGMQYLVKNAQ